MARLKDTEINGNLVVTGNIAGDLEVDGAIKVGSPTESNVFVTYRGEDIDVNKAGYWGALTTKHGIGSNYRHVLSMDWSGNDYGNLISQLCLPTIPGQGLFHRCNGVTGTPIGEMPWVTLLDSDNYTSYCAYDESNAQVISRWTSNSGTTYKVKRKIMSGITYVAGANAITHRISDFYFPIKVYGGFTQKSGNMQIFPESCCDAVEKYGISVRDITKTALCVLLGSGYAHTNAPDTEKGHLIIEYVSTETI